MEGSNSGSNLATDSIAGKILIDITEESRRALKNETIVKAFKNNVCTFYFKIGDQLGLDRTKEELYEEAAKINLKYNH